MLHPAFIQPKHSRSRKTVLNANHLIFRHRTDGYQNGWYIPWSHAPTLPDIKHCRRHGMQIASTNSTHGIHISASARSEDEFRPSKDYATTLETFWWALIPRWVRVLRLILDYEWKNEELQQWWNEEAGCAPPFVLITSCNYFRSLIQLTLTLLPLELFRFWD